MNDTGAVLPCVFKAALEQAALVAGHYLKEQFVAAEMEAHSFKNANPLGIVTRHDKHAETLIKDSLRKSCPQLAFIGEEQGEEGDAEARYVAYIDPIDGTTNFSQHNPHFAVMAAVYDRVLKRVSASVIYDPLGGAGGRMFSASRSEEEKQYRIYRNGIHVEAPVRRPPETGGAAPVGMLHSSLVGHCLQAGYLSESEHKMLFEVTRKLEEKRLRQRNSGSSGYDSILMIESMLRGHECACMARGGAAWDFLPALPFAEGLGGVFRTPADAGYENWTAESEKITRMRPDSEGENEAFFDWICWGSASVVNEVVAAVRDAYKEHGPVLSGKLV